MGEAMSVQSGHGKGLKRPESLVAWVSELVGTSLPELFFLKQSYEPKSSHILSLINAEVNLLYPYSKSSGNDANMLWAMLS